MAVTALQRQSEDKIVRQAYQRRKDEIYFFNQSMEEKEQAEQRAEKAEAEIERLRKENEELRTKYGEL